MRKLYIVGNGFDLHHQIPSAYGEFGRFLRINDPETASFVETYFAVDRDFWSEFEGRLAYFDAHSLIEHASDFLVSYAAEDWSDAYHHDYQYEIDRVVSALSVTMRARFADWVRQLPMPEYSELGPLALRIDPSAFFLNFNYTASLQTLYGIPNANVLHIHGSADDPTKELVLGHGWQPAAKDSFNYGIDPEDTDPRVVQGNEVIDRYFKATFKPTGQIISDNQPFFAKLNDVEQIMVMGHSLADVDLPYFAEVIRHIDANRVAWSVSYHGQSDNISRTRFESLNVPPDRVRFLQLTEF